MPTATDTTWLCLYTSNNGMKDNSYHSEQLIPISS